MRRISQLDDKRMGRVCGVYTSAGGVLLNYRGFWFLTEKSVVWRVRLTRGVKEEHLLSGTAPLAATTTLERLAMPGTMGVIIHRGIKAQLEPIYEAVPPRPQRPDRSNQDAGIRRGEATA